MALQVYQFKTFLVDNWGTTTPVSFDSLPTVGHHVMLGLSLYTDGSDFTPGATIISDNQSNSWGRDGGHNSGDGAHGGLALYRAVANTSAGTFTITIDGGGTGRYVAGFIAETSPVAVDVTNTFDNGSSVTSVQTGSVTPANSDNLVFSLVAPSSAGSAWTDPTSFTELYNQPNNSAHIAFMGAYRNTGATSAINPTWTAPSSVTTRGLTVAYKAASSAATFASNISATATVTAALSTSITPATGISATASVTASLSTGALMASALTASAVVAAALATSITMAAAVPCTAAVSASIGRLSTFVQGVGAIVDDSETSTLTFATTPAIGSQITIGIALYEMDPTAAMFSDNNGHGYTRDILESAGATLDGATALLRTKVTANSTTPFVITIHTGAMTSGDLPGRWWTWGAANHTGQHPTSPLDASAADGGFQTQDPTAGAMTASTNDYIVFLMLSKRAHANDTITPPSGYSTIINNPENSAHQSGAMAWATGTAVGSTTPTWHLFNTDSPSFRAVSAIYKSAASVSVASDIASTASVVGALSTAITPAAAIGAGATVAAALSTVIPLASTVSATAAISASLSTSITPSVAMSTTAAVSAALVTSITPAAAIGATATATASLATSIPLTTAIMGTATMAAALNTRITPAATIAATAAEVAILATAIVMTAAIPATATVSASLNGTAAILASGITAGAAISASVATAVTPAAAIAIAATVAAPLTTSIQPQAAITAGVTVVATLNTAITPVASVIASAVQASTLATAITPASTIAATGTGTAGLFTAITARAAIQTSAQLITSLITTPIITPASRTVVVSAEARTIVVPATHS